MFFIILFGKQIELFEETQYSSKVQCRIVEYALIQSLYE
jgi:hypothetical protein